jgi:thiol-disulfide isomerase/thioredoxin
MSRKYLAFATVFALVALSACSKATEVVSDAANTVGDGVGNVAEGVGNVADGAMDVVGDVAEGAVDVAGDAMEATGDAMEAVGDAAMDAAGDAVEAVDDVAAEAMEAAKNAADTTGDAMEATGDAMMGDDAMEEGAMMDKDDSAMMEEVSAVYADYTDGVLTDGEEKVLFFHASWCPTCVKEDGKLQEKVASGALGRNVYKVDYDSNTELRQQLGVTTKHTFVLLDGAGKVQESHTAPSEEVLNGLVNPA